MARGLRRPSFPASATIRVSDREEHGMAQHLNRPEDIFDRESGRALHLMLVAADEVMDDMEISQSMREYVHRRKGTARKLYPAAAWVRDPALRLKLGTASCLHCLGLKLLDDIIDADTPYDNRELIVGTEFCTKAYVMMNEVGVLPAFFQDYRQVWMPQLRHVTKEPTTPIHTIGEWERSTNLKAGEVIACYARFCFAAEGRLADFVTVRPVFRALGIMFTIINDYTGRQKPTEQHANLFALIARGLIRQDAVVALMNRSYSDFLQGISALPPQFDFYQPVTETYQTFQAMLAAPLVGPDAVVAR
jgi:hypothetical protein